MLNKIGVKVKPVKDINAALTETKTSVAIIDATTENLKQLAASPKKLKQFTTAGGWIMLWGLTPDGLADFNKIVGQNHLIRKFGMEEVILPTNHDPLLDGIKSTDICMESGEWSVSPPSQSVCAFRADYAWSYVVDTGNIAPFSKLPGPEFWKKEDPKNDLPDFPRNMLNGLTYNWRFGFVIGENEPLRWTVKLPREESVIGFAITPWVHARTASKVRLHFADGGKPADLTVQKLEKSQSFSFPARKVKSLEIEILSRVENKNPATGILNFQIQVARSADYAKRVKPLLNIGTLVKYPMGSGGVILNQMNIPIKESNLTNAAKKMRILSVLLEALAK